MYTSSMRQIDAMIDFVEYAKVQSTLAVTLLGVFTRSRSKPALRLGESPLTP